MGPGFILWGTAPLLISLGMRVVTRDWSDLGIKPVIGKNIHWYLLSFLAIPILMLVTLFVDDVFSLAAVPDFSLGKFLRTFLTALPIFFIFAIFEEVGWRGYLAPKLAALGVNRYLSAALVAFVWASWHLPYISELTWLNNTGDLGSFIPRFYLVCFAMAVVYGEIRNSTASFWPAVLMHAVANSFGHPLSAEYVKYVSGTEYLGSISNGLLFIALVFLLGVIISHRRSMQVTTAKSSV
ncbi:MAG: CPBP family intramembrane metalloprotease [Anaerolineales bacterium]